MANDSVMEWESVSPDSLVDICINFCLKSPETFCDTSGHNFKLRDNITLPKEICEKFLTTYENSTGQAINDEFISIFGDTNNSRIENVHISNSDITDEGLKTIFKQKVVELNIDGCAKISHESLKTIINRGSHLKRLNLGFAFRKSTNKTSKEGSDNEDNDSLDLPNLRYFSTNSWWVSSDDESIKQLLKPLTGLNYLDLSYCFNLHNLESITSMPNLHSLILYNVPGIQQAIPAICSVKTIKFLDISQGDPLKFEYPKPNYVLRQICEALPNLQYLDISGTNLAGTGVADLFDEEDVNMEKVPQTDIPGLASRVSNPLKFLGLLETSNDACHRHHIPALNISGSASEAQVLLSASIYLDRVSFLRKALNELFRIFRYELCRDQPKALELILKGMNNHIKDKHVQISGSASLFYIVKGEAGKYLNWKVRRRIIKTLLIAMAEHKQETTMIRNGCLTLCHLRIPQDVLFEYERLIKVLLFIVAEDEQDEFVQRIGIYLLNSLACQVDGQQKKLVGDLGAISTMIKLVEDRLARKHCDDVMEIAWSAMWNVTDETPTNCEKFLDGGGMNLFLGCLREFPAKEELLRNMMGLLGNVAEVWNLRRRLMVKEYIEVFSNLLENTSDGIEVSYNAAGILSHMASDGQEIWAEHNIDTPSRDLVLTRLKEAVGRWNIDISRNINYRSFEPILRLVKCRTCSEAQYWSVWALANLTWLYPDKYCKLVEDEGGVILLEELLKSSDPYPYTKELAKKVIDNCKRFKDESEFLDQ